MANNISNENELEKTCELVGRFMYHFAKLEEALDAIIRKVLDLDKAQARILAATLPFAKKISTARSAIAAQEKPKSWKIDADDVFKEFHGLNVERNKVAHSPFSPSENSSVVFRHAKADKILVVKQELWTSDKFLKTYSDMINLCEKLEKIGSEIYPVARGEYKYEFEDNFGSEDEYTAKIKAIQDSISIIGGTIDAIDKPEGKSFVKTTVVHQSKRMMEIFVRRYWADMGEEWIQEQIAEIEEIETGKVDLSDLIPPVTGW